MPRYYAATGRVGLRSGWQLVGLGEVVGGRYGRLPCHVRVRVMQMCVAGLEPEVMFGAAEFCWSCCALLIKMCSSRVVARWLS